MKKAIFGLILISLILLSGATGCPSKAATVSVQSNGLDVQFSKDAPPVSVNVNQEFPIHIDVLNNGGSYVTKDEAKFYLTSVSNLENVQTSLANTRTLNKESLTPDTLMFAEKAVKILFTVSLFPTITLPISSLMRLKSFLNLSISFFMSVTSALLSVFGTFYSLSE